MNKLAKPEMSPASSTKSVQKSRTGWLWLERITLVSGLVLLLAFAVFKLQQDKKSEAGLAAFYQQAQAAGPVGSTPDDLENVPANTFAEVGAEPAIRELPSEQPGYELWSEKRIREYQQSLQQEAAAPLGILRIERLGIEVPVYNGTDDFVLNRGVGRILGTARIDDPGNLGIAGHRDGFFRGLKDIQTGDVLELQSIHGAVQYRVGSTVIVDPSDVSVLAPTPERTLTLVTCYPFYFVGQAPKRFIVQATAESQIAMN